MNGQGKRVTIYINNTDQWHHQSLYLAILELLRREGCAGATVTQGVAGFGGSRRIKVAGLVEVVMDVPLVVTWIDRPDRVERVLPRLAEMVTAGLITVEDTQVYQYAATLREGLPDVAVEEVMTRTVTTVHLHAPLVEVVEKLLDKDYTALPVVDEANRVVGIISDTDLLERGDMAVSLSLKKAVDPDLARALIAQLRQSPHTVGGDDARARYDRAQGFFKRGGPSDEHQGTEAAARRRPGASSSRRPWPSGYLNRARCRLSAARRPSPSGQSSYTSSHDSRGDGP